MRELYLCINYIWQLTFILAIIGHHMYKNNWLNKKSINVLCIMVTILASIVLDGFHFRTLIEIITIAVAINVVNITYSYLRTRIALFKQI